jgi:hypothetical protein
MNTSTRFTNEWEKLLYNYAFKFINKDITESEYYKKHISRDKKIRFLGCPEVKFLKKESMNIYGKFLRNLSLGNRRRFAVESSGYTIAQLRRVYGWGNSRTEKFYKNIQGNYDKEFVAMLAIISRVPFLWFDEEDPLIQWGTYHFHFLRDAVMNVEEFKNLLLHTKLPKSFVRGVVVNINTDTTLYLRVEFQNKGVIIDLANRNAGANHLYHLQRILTEFQMNVFEADTVIPNQKNFIFVSRNIDNIPPECCI